MISSVKANNTGAIFLCGENSINQSNEVGDKSSDDPIELLRSLSDDRKTENLGDSSAIIPTTSSTANTSATTPSSTSPATGTKTVTYTGPTPPPSGISSKSVPKKPNVSIEKMFETFYQCPSGEFKPTFYNPFEVRHRRRTSRSQFKILERAFMDNCKPSAAVRKSLAQELNMSARSIQVWFQNRRAKLKTMLKNGKMTDSQMMEYLNQQKQQGISEEQEDLQDSPSSFEDSEVSESEEKEQQSCDNKLTNVFTTSERRNFPNSSKATPIDSVNVRETEMMTFGNSYPNQSRNRSYSLPTIQRSPQLPFKQLQEALFGCGLNSNNEQQLQQQMQHQPPQPQQIPYYNTSLNAFQHYYRASNVVMSQVNNNLQNVMQNHQNYYDPHGQIQVHFTPLNQSIESEYQVDPNRFRPRSSSFAVGQRATNNNGGFNTENAGYNYDFLSVIKEDSPISEYMSIPANSYFDGNEADSSEINNQIHSLDLDYFMTSTNGNDSYSGHQNSNSFCSSSTNSSLMASIPNSPVLNTTNSSSNSTSSNGNSSHYMNDLTFLPQPTNEILLSTLIDDEHFLV